MENNKRTMGRTFGKMLEQEKEQNNIESLRNENEELKKTLSIISALVKNK